MERPWFIGQPAPQNYVAGLGRGATGFTTRSDIGPARNLVADPFAEMANLAKAKVLGKRERDDDNEEEEGGGGGRGGDDGDMESIGNNLENEQLFASIPYEKDDEEADNIWTQIDEKMNERRRQRREERERHELIEYRKAHPKIESRFADLKQELKDVSADEWSKIPNPGDISFKYRKKAAGGNNFVPTPDSLLISNRADAMTSSIDINSGFLTPSGFTSTIDGTTTSQMAMVDLTQVGAAKKTMLLAQLQTRSDSVEGQTSIDRKGYLTDLNSLKTISDSEIGDIKRVRTLLKSATTTNPTQHRGWIVMARLEERAGKLSSARKYIMRGCQNCPENENVWLEAARLHPPEEAKSIIAQGIKQIPKSTKLWLEAAHLENNLQLRKKVLRRALLFIANSERLWKAAIELEELEEARILLGRAVECIPQSVEMWLALARLEDYDRAKEVLNEARSKNPTDVSIWIAASKLEEANNGTSPDLIIGKAVQVMIRNKVAISREQWLSEAEKAEKAGALLTCSAIINHTIGLSVEESHRRKVWMKDAEERLSSGHPHAARSIYNFAVSIFPNNRSLWMELAFIEKRHGSAQSLEELLSRAIKACPKAEDLWLMMAKEKWLAQQVGGAREILKQAFAQNPGSERIFLAAVKLEKENKEYTRARAILQKARESVSTEKIWIKSAKLERELSSQAEERQILEKGLKQFPTSDKLWQLFCLLQYETQNLEAARASMKKALEQCPKSERLHLTGARFEEKVSINKARSFLDGSRLKIPSSALLWLESIRLEQRAGNQAAAIGLLEKALKEIKDSGLLWAEAILLTPSTRQQSRIVAALNTLDKDPLVSAAVARVLWADGKHKKARSWISKALSFGEKNGDVWALAYKFELQHGTQESQTQICSRCVQAAPNQGEKWTSVSKAIENVKSTTEEILLKVAYII